MVTGLKISDKYMWSILEMQADTLIERLADDLVDKSHGAHDRDECYRIAAELVLTGLDTSHEFIPGTEAYQLIILVQTYVNAGTYYTDQVAQIRNAQI